MGSNLGLGELAKWKQGVAQRAGRDREEKVGLVLVVVYGHAQRPIVNATVVSGGQMGGTERQRTSEQYPKLQHAVALNAGVGSAALEVGLREVVHDRTLKRLAEVEDVERDLKLGGDSPSVESIIEATARLRASVARSSANAASRVRSAAARCWRSCSTTDTIAWRWS